MNDFHREALKRWLPFPERTVYRAALFSNCVRRKIGAVIVDSRGVVISSGWNAPKDQELSCDNDCPRAHSGVAAYSQYTEGEGRCIAVHAEAMALAGTTEEQRKGAVMYITAEPCSDCEKLLQISGLAEWGVV